MTLRYISVAGSIAAALLLAACGDDEPAETEPVAEALEAEPPAMEAEPPAMAAGGAPGFGTEADVAYAAALWAALDEANLVGDLVLHGTFYEGGEPHGFVLETLFADVEMNATAAVAIVKRNYGPEGVTVDEVDANPGDHLAAITVMYQRPGFNPDNNDWFWVKYLPDGSLDLAGETQMAGNVGGCIGCHGDAPGGDWVFVTDRALPAPAEAAP